MSARHLTMLGVLGAIWGAAFMLIEIGLRDFEPSTLIAGRLGSAALALALFAVARGRLVHTLARLRPFAGRLALAGVVSTAIPVFLIAWGQQHDSGIAAGWGSTAAVLALGVAATALAFQLYFGLIVAVGAARAIVVIYAVPSLALVYGIALLDEPFTWVAFGGLALVLAGVGLGTGAARRRVASPA